MKSSMRIFAPVFALLVFFCGNAGAADTLKVDVLSNGGGYLVETAYKLRFSLGPTPIRGICETVRRLDNGFWPAVTQPAVECDLGFPGKSPFVGGEISSEQLDAFLNFLFKGAEQPEFIELLDINMDGLLSVLDYVILIGFRQKPETGVTEFDQVN